MMLEARILAESQPPPPRAVVVDGPLSGGELCLSHWDGSPTPPTGVSGDTGTDLALAAINRPILLDPIDVVVNDHVDADGLLAMATLVDQATANANARLLAMAAAAGDFKEWHGAEAQRLVYDIEQRITNAETAAAPGDDSWRQRLVDDITDDLTGCLMAAEQPNETVRAAIANIESTIDRLTRADGFEIAHDTDCSCGNNRLAAEPRPSLGLLQSRPRTRRLPTTCNPRRVWNHLESLLRAITTPYLPRPARTMRRPDDGDSYITTPLLATGHTCWAPTQCGDQPSWPDLSPKPM